MTETTIRRADYMDAGTIAPLFDAYRQFYQQPADLERAQAFIAARLRAEDSVIFIARQDHRDVGFTQLYPSFSSVGTGRIFVLNDIYTLPEVRGSGAGRALLQAAADFARDEGAIRLTLSTATDNRTAQAVYEGMGWVRDDRFWTYNLAL